MVVTVVKVAVVVTVVWNVEVVELKVVEVVVKVPVTWGRVVTAVEVTVTVWMLVNAGGVTVLTGVTVLLEVPLKVTVSLAWPVGTEATELDPYLVPQADKTLVEAAALTRAGNRR